MEKIMTTLGTFINNSIITDDGETIDCITYGSIKREVENKRGFFQLVWSDQFSCWKIIQYILLDS